MTFPLKDSSSHILDERDALLASSLVRIQLPPSDYAKADQRYQTLAAWIEREGSALKGRVLLVYGQGSMAIGAVVAAKASNDEFDVDAMVALSLPEDSDPETVLDLLYRVVRGEPGSRYYDCTVRCSRCVQVRYADGMHVDLTPAVPRAGRPERESIIFHHRAETPSVPGQRVIANPYGFADWFRANTPPDALFKSVLDEYAALARVQKAEAEPLPGPREPHEASRAVASLQLIKRFRNLRYNDRDARCPPSVMLSKLVAEHKVLGAGLSRALLSHATNLRDLFAAEQASGRLIEVRNPACWADNFSDRWPATAKDQALWIGDLDRLVARLTTYVHGDLDLSQRQAILAELFGETAALSAVRALGEQIGAQKAAGQSRHTPGAGRLILPIGGITPALGRVTPRTDYFGGTVTWRPR